MKTNEAYFLELSVLDRDRLIKLVEAKLPHLLDEPRLIEWHIVEVLSFWGGRGRASRRRSDRDWPMTILNRMLQVELRRFNGQLPNAAEVRAEQAARRLAEEGVRQAEAEEAVRRSELGVLGLVGGMPSKLPRGL